MVMSIGRRREESPGTLRWVFSATVCLLFTSLTGADPVALCSRGKPHHPVVVCPEATPRVQAVAQELVGTLGRMTGTTFTLGMGDGTTGIAVGTAADFPKLELAENFAIKALADRERYILRSHEHGLHVIGATELAVEDAVWDLLYRLGYRQFFPGRTWEVVPSHPELGLDVDVEEKPAYVSRRIWYGFGLWDHNAEPYRAWCARNRAVQGFALSTGHAYDRIIRRNKATFDARPEFYGLLGTERKSSKMCIGNPELRDMVIRYALAQFEANPDLESVSMDPSDGSNWCECPRCADLGTVTDRAVTLANAVAAAVTQVRPQALVGMYAYNQHSPPPTIEVHPNVVISIAAGFIRGGYTVQQLFDEWGKQAQLLGVREYFSVQAWDRNLPGKGRASNLDYLCETIPAFHADGGRFFSAESGDNWGPHGLGYYIASRIMWDLDEAKRVDAIVDDFLARAFGPAEPPMRECYGLLNGANKHPLSGDLVGRLYRALEAARKLTDDREIRARINDIILYTRYVELYRTYTQASGDDRQAAFETLIRYGYRIRTSMMIHTKALYRDMVRRDKSVAIPEDARWNIPEDKNPWKDSTPFSDEELRGILAAGIAANETIAFRPIAYGTKLAPPADPIVTNSGPAPPEITIRGTNRFYLWVPEAPATIALQVTGGLIPHYRDRGDARLELIPDEHEFGEAVDRGSVPPDGKEREVTLTTTYQGLHILQVSDGSDKTRVRWPRELAVSLPCSLAERVNWQGRGTFVFWVPKGVTTVGVFVSGAAEFLDGTGEAVGHVRSKAGEYAALNVPPGQDGALWTMKNAQGRIALMTVPPYVATAADALLLPRELKR
jgi:hypothetical protein